MRKLVPPGGRWKWPRPSIGVKLIGGFVAVLAPIVAIGLISTSVAINTTSRQIQGSYRSSLKTLSQNLGGDLERLGATVDAFAGHEFLHIVNQSPPGAGTVLLFAQLLERLTFYSLIHRAEHELDVYLLSHERRFGTTDRITVLPHAAHPQVIEEYARFQGRWAVHDVSTPPTGRYLVYSRFAHTSPGRVGIVVTARVHERTVSRLLENLPVEHGGFVFLVDQRGALILPRSVERAKVEGIISPHLTGGPPEGGMTVRLGTELYRVFLTEPGRTHLTMGLLLPEQRYTEPIRLSRIWLFAMAVGALLFGSVFAVYEHRSILRPIRELIGAMRHVREGSFAHSVSSRRRDEIGVLAEQFNAMVRRIAALVDEVNVEHLKHQLGQLRLFQSQIKPHFLYNCLNVIYRLCVSGDTQAASELALRLGKYYRMVTRCSADTIPLERELENASTYMEIHRIRHPRRFSYSVTADEEVRGAPVPPLTIQPIVENAVVHGLENLGCEGSVEVRAYSSHGFAVIEVADTGRGLDPSELRMVNAQIRDPSPDRRNVGLSNSFWRLRLRFGEDADLDLRPRDGCGLLVRVRVPIRGGHDAQSSDR